MNIEIIPVTAFQQNCSLIWDDEKNAAIIDPGGNAEKLIQRIEELELNLKAVLLTHGHLDHVGAAETIRDHFNIEIWGSQEDDRFLFESLPQHLSSLAYLIFLHLHLIAGLIKKAKKFKLVHLPLKFFIFLVIHLATLVLLNMKKYCFYWRCPFPKQYWSYRLPSWKFRHIDLINQK